MEEESESCRLRHSIDAPCLQAVYKGCTRDAHRMYQLKTHGPPVSIPCTPLVHDYLLAGNELGMAGIEVVGDWVG